VQVKTILSAMDPSVSGALYTKEVEVIQVTRAVESHTGDSIFQVQFGEVVEVDEELRRFVPATPFSKPQRFVYPAVLTLFIKTAEPLPYKTKLVRDGLYASKRMVD
jgi:hypothetical protein